MTSAPKGLDGIDMRVEKGWHTRRRNIVTIANAAEIHGPLIAFVPAKSTGETELVLTCLLKVQRNRCRCDPASRDLSDRQEGRKILSTRQIFVEYH
jgi:hypothetical protein